MKVSRRPGLPPALPKYNYDRPEVEPTPQEVVDDFLKKGFVKYKEEEFKECGVGLKTTRRWEKGDTLLVYTGRYITEEDLGGEEDDKVVEVARGMEQYKKRIFVRGDSSNYAQFINDGTYGEPGDNPDVVPNCLLVEPTVGDKVPVGRPGAIRVVATEPIEGTPQKPVTLWIDGYGGLAFWGRRDRRKTYSCWLKCGKADVPDDDEMVRCQRCANYAHRECVGYNDYDGDSALRVCFECEKPEKPVVKKKAVETAKKGGGGSGESGEGAGDGEDEVLEDDEEEEQEEEEERGDDDDEEEKEEEEEEEVIDLEEEGEEEVGGGEVGAVDERESGSESEWEPGSGSDGSQGSTRATKRKRSTRASRSSRTKKQKAVSSAGSGSGKKAGSGTGSGNGKKAVSSAGSGSGKKAGSGTGSGSGKKAVSGKGPGSGHQTVSGTGSGSGKTTRYGTRSGSRKKPGSEKGSVSGKKAGSGTRSGSGKKAVLGKRTRGKR